ncbi:MAG: hypothetical protein ACI867_002390 [Glaciecola sp.]|jgi:hypothetical protein
MNPMIMRRPVTGGRFGRGRTAALVISLGLVATACGGPREPLEVGHFTHRSDIVLGDPPVVVLDAPVALPPTALPVKTIIIRLSPPATGTPITFPVPKPIDRGPCPPSSPIAAPKVVATTDVALPPAPASYTFRNDGSYEMSGANAGKGTIEGESTRTVANVIDLEDGSFSFDIMATLEDTTTITSYLLTPGAEDGLMIDKVVTKAGEAGSDDYQESTFDPVPDLRVLSLPVVTGDNWNAQGIDPATGQGMAFHATVVTKDRADACGELIDTVTVEIDGSFVVCPTPPRVDGVPPLPDNSEQCDISAMASNPTTQSSSTFHARYEFATQFGGLMVQDFSEILTETPSANIYRLNEATINSMPLDPVAPPLLSELPPEEDGGQSREAGREQ